MEALRPSPGAALLADALAGVAERWSALHGIRVGGHDEGRARPMPPDAELRAAACGAGSAGRTEGKHARATWFGLTPSYMDGESPGTCGTTGSGSTRQQRGDRRVGLAAMRQRIEGLSGTLQVESEPGGGTAIGPRPRPPPPWRLPRPWSGPAMAPAPAEASA